ncbi:MAG: hypothetical protein CMM84_02025 [Rhodothermaceae bacterium]|nr:hypothetical protein [Rhodothermaceae bacterium]MBC11897.1 hypothetical protein [Rhodothermaceae bacterium]
MTVPRALLVLAALLLGGCGGDKPQGIEVTEAPADSELLPGARRGAPLDTVYADSGLFSDPRLHPDSLRADSLRRDSLARDSALQAAAAPVAPDFRTAFPAFLAAVREGRSAVRARTAFSDALPEADFPMLYDAAFGEGPFRDGILALTARDFRREGTARVATVTVGYDGDGNVVREDEALTESAVILTFDVVEGTYRLVRIDLAG